MDGGTDQERVLSHGELLITVHLVDLGRVGLSVRVSPQAYVNRAVEGRRILAGGRLLGHDLLQEITVNVGHLLATINHPHQSYRKQSSLFSSSVGKSAEVSFT